MPHYEHTFFHPDYTVGFGIAPNPGLNHAKPCANALADYTADREFHPAPKMTHTYFVVIISIAQLLSKVNMLTFKNTVGRQILEKGKSGDATEVCRSEKICKIKRNGTQAVPYGLAKNGINLIQRALM